MNDVKPLAPTDEFLHAAQSLGIAFDPGEVERLGHYLALLLDANSRMNLTRITAPGEAWKRHVLDSLTLLPCIVAANAARVVDIGSGGGAPGIPLAIVLPDVAFTLIEATGKKCAYLESAANALRCSNVAVHMNRAESAGAPGAPLRELFDLATARALGPLRILLELAAPLVKVGGHILAIKGEKADEEIHEAKRALHALHCGVVDVHDTPTGRIVVIEKRARTPGKYPRSPGEPKRNPL